MHLESVDDFSHSLEVYNGNEDEMMHHQGVISPAAAISADDQVPYHVEYSSIIFIIFAHISKFKFFACVSFDFLSHAVNVLVWKFFARI